MKIKHLLLASAFAVASMSTAHAATLTTTATPNVADANTILNIDFDTLMTPYTLTGDGIILGPPGIPNVSAPPAGDSTNYLSVPYSNSTGSATLMFGPVAGGLAAIRSFSFLLGSVDNYNTFDLLDQSGTSFFSFTGAMLPVANGDQSSLGNRNVKIYLADNETIGGIRIGGTQYAAEVDNFLGGVPEPATWAMMIVGFGMTGAMIRRRRPALQLAA